MVQDKILLTPKLKIGNLLLNFTGISIQTSDTEIDMFPALMIRESISAHGEFAEDHNSLMTLAVSIAVLEI